MLVRSVTVAPSDLQQDQRHLAEQDVLGEVLRADRDAGAVERTSLRRAARRACRRARSRRRCPGRSRRAAAAAAARRAEARPRRSARGCACGASLRFPSAGSSSSSTRPSHSMSRASRATSTRAGDHQREAEAARCRSAGSRRGPGVDEGGQRGGADQQHQRGAHAGHDHRHGERQLDAQQHAAAGHADPAAGLDERAVDALQAGDRVAQHRQDRRRAPARAPRSRSRSRATWRAARSGRRPGRPGRRSRCRRPGCGGPQPPRVSAMPSGTAISDDEDRGDEGELDVLPDQLPDRRPGQLRLLDRVEGGGLAPHDVAERTTSVTRIGGRTSISTVSRGRLRSRPARRRPGGGGSARSPVGRRPSSRCSRRARRGRPASRAAPGARRSAPAATRMWSVTASKSTTPRYWSRSPGDDGGAVAGGEHGVERVVERGAGVQRVELLVVEAWHRSRRAAGAARASPAGGGGRRGPRRESCPVRRGAGRDVGHPLTHGGGGPLLEARSPRRGTGESCLSVEPEPTKSLTKSLAGAARIVLGGVVLRDLRALAQDQRSGRRA